ncbi:O-acetyl-ADP-ribose deacetylase (regulator of RNase III), contains Macro domain [Chitinophaga sp. YR573]|uniref:macro domain-containing protein n=1 Tax=Chitinophaga sp. YR573 TaxID=1881040 RepID=UPI0008C87C34|nr:macro domain-containing protein [Chitinophaga sp. YR573]SEW20841.1 O-acetyl-ADP-ribose deacetylase (regulator of RNase III), contains Macro domain [Chitinophaga sp. YR573]
MAIHYVVGDATSPIGSGSKVIAHICNNQGYWGKGFVMALSKKWPFIRDEYKKWYYNNNDTFKLGAVLALPVGENILVANIIGQEGIYKDKEGNPPIRYDELKTGLFYLTDLICAMRTNMPTSVHMPRIGCGLAGGEWKIVEPIIESTLCEAGIEVYVYDLK